MPALRVTSMLGLHRDCCCVFLALCSPLARLFPPRLFLALVRSPPGFFSCRLQESDVPVDVKQLVVRVELKRWRPETKLVRTIVAYERKDVEALSEDGRPANEVTYGRSDTDFAKTDRQARQDTLCSLRCNGRPGLARRCHHSRSAHKNPPELVAHKTRASVSQT